jgi:hypothetical protein
MTLLLNLSGAQFLIPAGVGWVSAAWWSGSEVEVSLKAGKGPATEHAFSAW